jgi:hypothetical protein
MKSDNELIRRISVVYNSLPEDDKLSVMKFEIGWPDLSLNPMFNDLFKIPRIDHGISKKHRKRTLKKFKMNDPRCVERRQNLINSLRNNEKVVIDSKFMTLLNSCSTYMEDKDKDKDKDKGLNSLLKDKEPNSLLKKEKDKDNEDSNEKNIALDVEVNKNEEKNDNNLDKLLESI